MVVDSSYYLGCHPRLTWGIACPAWFRAGTKLAGQGSEVLPLMGFLAYGVGKLVLATALLYFIFAAGSCWARVGVVVRAYRRFVKRIVRVGYSERRRAHRGADVLARSSCHRHLLPIFSFWATTRFTILVHEGDGGRLT